MDGAAPSRGTLLQRVGLRLMPLHLLRLRLRDGMTVGVRAAVIVEDRVFLVRHTYVPGWYLPGGGVDASETVPEALGRELREEGNLELTGEPTLLGILNNRELSRRDHVAFYLVREARQIAPKRPDHEIAEAGFFALDALPDDLTPATRRRLDEIAGRRQADGLW